MNDDRPTPEQMLERVRAEAGASDGKDRPGRLKLFFGYAAGVGKTYAMLQAARAQQAEGKDVAVGYVEPHGRLETEALLAGLERLPPLEVAYRGTVLCDFDLDAALARKPQIILVDELAHTNAAGMRHVKRWQDVEELLAAGIDVYSTVNVQHIESLNDIVAQISGVTVRETVPDHMIQTADELALVDLPPDELLERLRQGKVYVPAQAATALERFFRRENLVALREIALRQTAERVHADVETARRGTAARVPWPTNERLLVCVGPSPTSAKVVRAAKRLADRLGAPWIAVHVDSSSAGQGPSEREHTHRHLVLADRLGAEVANLTGDDLAAELIKYAESRNVTKFVIGKTDPPQSFWRRRKRTLVDRLVESSGNIDVLIVRGVDEPLAVESLKVDNRSGWQAWLGAATALAAATAAALAFHAWGFTEANLVLTYLLAVVFIGFRFGSTPAIISSVAAVLLFDVLFTQPFYRITVHDSQYIVTFAVMLIVGLLASTLTARVRRQAETARSNEHRTEALYRLTRRLSGVSDSKRLVGDAEQVIAEVFDAYAVIFLPDKHGRILPIVGGERVFAASAGEFAAAQWVFDHNETAGRGTDTLPGAEAFYLPLAVPNGVVGVLAVQPAATGVVDSFSDRHLLDTLASQVALAIERSQLTREAQESRIEAETEKLRSSLLSAVSHDIRTPLAGIAGAASSLAAAWESLDAAARNELLSTITDESERLSQLVENLLHMTRLSSGKVVINRQWHPVEDVIGSTLGRMERQLAGRPLSIRVEDTTPLGHFDSVLIEQLLVNLLDNAVKYSPEHSPIDVSARPASRGIELEVADRGKGFPEGDESRVFELFYRGMAARPDRRGTGIGLAICRAIAEAHGGTIEARNRQGGGAVIRVLLPHLETPPQVNTQNLEPAGP
ncbi:MAG: sensor histidine kinase KdpD [Pirellulales bacterium]